MNIKSYLTNLKPSSTLVINEQSKEMERQGKEVIKFGFGQSPFPIPDRCKIVGLLIEPADKTISFFTLIILVCP